MILAGICIYIVLAHLKLFGVFLGHLYKSYFSVMPVQYCIDDRYNNYTGCLYDIFMMCLPLPLLRISLSVSESCTSFDNDARARRL